MSFGPILGCFGGKKRFSPFRDWSVFEPKWAKNGSKRHFWGQNVKKISFGVILGRFGGKKVIFHLYATGHFLSQKWLKNIFAVKISKK